MRFLSLLGLLLITEGGSRAQCPSATVLLHRIHYLMDSSKISGRDQLSELLPYEKQMNSCAYKNDSPHVILLKRIGVIYLDEADYLRAVQYYRQAINLITANAGRPTVNSKDLFNSYYWLSTMYDSLKDVTNSMRAVDSCIKISFRLNSPANLACLYAFDKRIEYLYDMGDYRRCADDAAVCETLAREFIQKAAGAALLRAKAIASNSFGWHINSLLALRNFDEAEEILLSRIGEYQKAGLTNYLGVIYDQLAQLEMHKLNYEKALVYFKQELTYLTKAGYDFNCKQTLNAMGNDIYFSHFHDNISALKYYRKALSYINKNDLQDKEDDEMESLNIYNHIGNVYAQSGNFDSAMYFFQRAFDQIKPGLNEATVLQVPTEDFKALRKLNYLSELLIDKADACWKHYLVSSSMNDIMEATRIYRMADQLLDRIKREQTDMRSKLFWRKDTRRLYEHAIAACYRNNNMEDAFYFFEKSRAVLLNDQLNEQHWIKGEDIFRRTQLKKKILLLNDALGNGTSSTQEREALQKELFDKNHELEILDQLIKEHNPLFYQSFLDTSHLALNDVRHKILKDHQALFELFEGDSATYALTITPGHAYITLMNKMKFDSLTNSYIRLLSNPNQLNGHFDEFIQTSRQLQQLIFQNDPPPTGRIIISPEGHYFPFESLVMGGTVSNPVYFINDHSVSYTYSARYLLDDFSSTANMASGSLLGIAPMQYGSNTGLAALPESGHSLEHIKSYLPDADNLTAANASRNNFLLHFADYRIIQLYTHASDSGEHKEPVIYFSDSTLNLSELITEKKPATRLIVLSACETGTGKLYQGEGVFSFNRGFAALGIPSSVTNLWSIDNVSTYRLTEIFYKYLSLGMPIDLALQKAKLEFIQKSEGGSRLPYYWAAAILVGKTDPVILAKTAAWKHVFVILAVVGFFYLTWKLSPKKRREELANQPV